MCIQKKLLFLLTIVTATFQNCSPKYIKRDSLPREIAFTKAFVFPFILQNGEESEFSELAQEEVIKTIEKWKKFDVLSFSETRRYLRKEPYHGKDYSKLEILNQIGEATGSDLVIIGTQSKRNIELKFFSPISGVVLFEINESVSEKLNVHSIRALLDLLLRRAFHYIPFDALVIATKGNKVKINAGRRNGLHHGSKVTVFEILSYRNEGERVDYQRIPIASLGIINLQQTESIARVLRHNEIFPIQKYNKISFIDFFTPIDQNSSLDNF